MIKEYSFLPKITGAFLAAFLGAYSVVNIMKYSPINYTDPQLGHAITILFIMFVWLCFAIYTLKVIAYELVYAAKKAIIDANKDLL